MKVIIIDDEKAMHLIMKQMLSKIDEVDVLACFQETSTAYDYLITHDVDMIFMDINMPKESGLEFATRLRELGKLMRIVFVTSHKEYSLPAFDVYAFDYMVKPVNQVRLQHTVQRALSGILLENAVTVKNETTAIQVKFNCLGGMEIRTDQDVLVKWKTSKSAELFGYLLIHKGRLISRARIIEVIFGETPHKNSESYLNTTVYQLRKLLSTYGLKESLYSDNNHYALVLNEVYVDLLHFEAGCKRMAVIEDSQIEQALELEQLYTGDLFGDRVFPWARGEVERIWSMYTSFSSRLCDALLLRGDIQTVIQLLMKLLAYNELEENTIKLLMNALALQKNKEALRQRYMQYTDTVHKELGISPSAEVMILYGKLMFELES
jgi:two-component system LytT family response regulator